MTIDELVAKSPRLQRHIARMEYGEIIKSGGFVIMEFKLDGWIIGYVYLDLDDKWSASRDLMDALRCEIKPSSMVEFVQIQIGDAVWTLRERVRRQTARSERDR